MKASELMIMDWVLLDGTPIQVAGLHNRKVGVHKRRRSIYCSWHSDGEFRPIPLTEEILVKNGFVCTQDKEWPEVLYWELETNEEYFAIDENRFTDYVFYNYAGIHINYVHQLQHLLRLCDIEKEITI